MLLVLLVASAAVAAAAGSADVSTLAPEAARPKPRVSLDLTRTGWAYRWEYRISVRVRTRASGRPLAGLRVRARAAMDAPGHHMEAGPARLRDRGGGTYQATVRFYMPGDWRITVVVAGANVNSSTTSFDVTLR